MTFAPPVLTTELFDYFADRVKVMNGKIKWWYWPSRYQPIEDEL